MTTVKVANKIIVNNIPKDLKDFIKEELYVDNPEYINRVKLKKWIGNTPKHILLYETDKERIILPYGFIDRLERFLFVNGIKFHIEKENNSVPIKITEKKPLSLYNYQEKAVNEMMKYNNGILVSPAGSGKTRMAMEMISRRGEKTLWLTNNLSLLRQSKRVFETFFGNKAGEISGGKINIQDVTFATVQTLSKVNLNDYRNTFGMIIVDEVHRVVGGPTKAMQFYKILSSLNTKYKYGVTATLFAKKNDMSVVPVYTVGEVRHTVLRKEIEIMTAKHIMYALYTPPSEIYLNSDRTIDYNKLINYLATDINRNVDILVNLLNCEHRHNLVLSNRNKQLEILSDMLESYNIKHHILIGPTKEADRDKVTKDFTSGKVRFLLSNYQLAKEGLDFPIADTLHFVSPMRDKKTIIQSAGRVERIYEGKTDSLIYDYVDVNIGMIKKMYWDRRRSLNARE